MGIRKFCLRTTVGQNPSEIGRTITCPPPGVLFLELCLVYVNFEVAASRPIEDHGPSIGQTETVTSSSVYVHSRELTELAFNC